MVTVAVMAGAPRLPAQVGAVQVTRLDTLSGLVVAPSTPAVAPQVKLRLLLWGSLAVTPKVAVCPGRMLRLD